MAIQTTVRKVQYDGDGTTTVFDVPFPFVDNAHLFVLLYDPVTEVETPQTITTHYTISGSGPRATAEVTMGTAPPAGKELLIYRDTEIIQPYELFDNEAQTATNVEASLDRLTMIAQELEEGLSRLVQRNIVLVSETIPCSNTAVTDVFLARITGAPTGTDHPFTEHQPIAGSTSNQAISGGRSGTFKFVDLCETDKTNDYVFVIQMLDTSNNVVYRSWQPAETVA